MSGIDWPLGCEWKSSLNIRIFSELFIDGIVQLVDSTFISKDNNERKWTTGASISYTNVHEIGKISCNLLLMHKQLFQLLSLHCPVVGLYRYMYVCVYGINYAQ